MVAEGKDVFEAVVKDLLPDETYVLQVQTVGISALGPRSAPCPFRPPAGRPYEAPRELQIVDASQDALHVSWQPPTQANGKITRYW